MDIERAAYECYEQFLKARKQHPSAQDIALMLKERYNQNVDKQMAMKLLIKVIPSFYGK